MARDMFGLKFRIVSGYKNSPDVKLAMERGEVDGTFANGWSSVATDRPEWIRDKKIRIIVQHGFRRHPDLPEVPLFSELARSEAERQAIVFMMARQEADQAVFRPARPAEGAPGALAPRLRRHRARPEIHRARQ